MKLFKFRKEVKQSLTVDDLVLMTMLNFPEGALGESSIHEFLYEITKTEEFKIYHEVMNFNKSNEYHFSPYIHRSIDANTKYLGKSFGHNASSSSWAMLSDDLRFDFYTEVFDREKEFSKNIIDYSPKVYYLSSSGRSVAILVLKQKLTKEQHDLVKSLADKV